MLSEELGFALNVVGYKLFLLMLCEFKEQYGFKEDLDRLRRLVQRQPEEFDPGDPENKLPDGKLSRRGVETCYKLFAQGKSRYHVSRAMKISFGAATYRLNRWREEGGNDREQRPLN